MSSKPESEANSGSRGHALYSVKTICQLTGLNEHTLRAWERRYQVVAPDRLGNGRRVYCLSDLEKLKLVTLLVRKGFLIGNIASGSIESLSALVNDAQSIATEQTGGQKRALEYLSKLKQYLCDYDLLTMQSVLQQSRMELGVKVFLSELILPLMREVGEAFTAGDIGIGQEHAYTSIVRSELTQLLYLFTQTHSHPGHKREESVKIFAIGTNEGNLHEFGALISAVYCALHGFPVYYFGANMPAHAMAQAAEAVGANCILLGLPSMTLMPPQVIDRYVQELKANMPAICQLWVGGQLTFGMLSDRSIRKLSSLIELDELLESIRDS